MFKNITQTRFDRASVILLWIEATIFSGVYGAAFHSWAVGVIIFLGTARLMSKPQTVVYTVFVMSFLWAWIFVALGFEMGGWIGSVVLGVVVFFNGVRLHFRDLKRLWMDADIAGAIKTAQWRQKWSNNGWQNLN